MASSGRKPALLRPAKPALVRARPAATEERALDPTTAWARDVVDGRIVAGELVRHAADRHLRDLREARKRGLFWAPERAAHAINFFPSALTITGGLKVGQPFHLLPYTLFLTGSLYGWVRDSGLRRFRTAWVETGKGQAKSPWMAALGLYEVRFRGVPRAEVYAFAETKDQAKVLFRDAVAMCRAKIPGVDDPDDPLPLLEEVAGFTIRGSGDNAWKIEWDGSAADLGTCIFLPMATGDAISGPKPILVLGDEVHEHKTDDAIELWAAALAKMAGDPLMVLGTNTPAANQIVGVTYSDYYASIAKGEFPDDSSLAFIATVDKGDDPLADEATWYKSLPALGITYEIEKIRDEVAKARQLPSKALKVKRLFFGIRIGAAECWIDEAAWEDVQGDFDEAALVGFPCYLSLDLSSRKDLTALGIVWDVGEGLAAKIVYWTPADTIVERAREDKVPYHVWAESPDATGLHKIPGPVIDKHFVASEVKRLLDRHDVRGLAFDTAQIADFEAALADMGVAFWRYEGPEEPAGDGLMLVRHGQGFRGMGSEKSLWMPRSVEQTEDVILSRAILIQASPVTDNCSANTKLNPDHAGNRAPDKRRTRGRIDGMIALYQGVGLAKAGLKVKAAPKPGIRLF
jgi:phage terminase large subunit-like protein